jgi:hypothetical protein
MFFPNVDIHFILHNVLTPNQEQRFELYHCRKRRGYNSVGIVVGWIQFPAGYGVSFIPLH